MKSYYCAQCDHKWIEPKDSKHKSGWGCPNGCASVGRELSLKNQDIIIDNFERMLRAETKEDEKSKIRYHLNLLRNLEKYPFSN